MPACQHSRLLAVFAIGLLGGALGCGGRQPPAKHPDPVLYTPEAAVLFDDVLAPAVFGFDPQGRHPASDPKLRERTRQAEFVVPTRVETVSRTGGFAHKGAYEVVLVASGPPLVGLSTDSPFVLHVASTSPSYSWVDGAGTGWVGSRLLLFARRYRDGGVIQLHFRGEPDTPEVRAAVQRDAGLRVLR
jgi:hypothetical protein